MKIFQVFIDYEADKKIATSLFLFFSRQAVKGFDQNFVSRAVSNPLNQVLLNFGNGPGLADWSAPLRVDR